MCCYSAEGEDHWAFQVLRGVDDLPENSHPIDFFIDSRLGHMGIDPSEKADPYTLLRRISLTLTGLPPSLEEIETLVAQSESDSIEPLIEHYLDSPHYGERWGRHWLDIARYVQGTIKVDGINRIDLAEPYRDYVVRSFNADKPYDQFIAEQLAGDLLPKQNAESKNPFDPLIATAFLSIGPWFEECTDPNKLRLDIIDEQISTMTRAFLALDFACARCHDHKFDPIPTRDYYALAGIFRSTEITGKFSDEWKDGRPRLVRQLMTDDEKEADLLHRAESKKLLETRRQMLQQWESMTVSALPDQTQDNGSLKKRTIVAIEAEDFAGHKNLRTETIGDLTVLASRRQKDQWTKYRVILPQTGNYTLLARYASARPTPVQFELEGDIREDPVFERPTFGETPDDFRWIPIPLGVQEKGSLHFRFLVAPHHPFPLLDRFRIVSGDVSTETKEWREFIDDPTRAQRVDFLPIENQSELIALEDQILDHFDNGPEFLPTVAATEAEPTSLPVHVGGDVYQTEGEPVPRSVPTLGSDLITGDFSILNSESGRVELAEWLAHPKNPLTARVMVNRIWHWHFGTGLVRTPDDFGIQGASPTHPDLLDWLAQEFIESGWSIKHLQRLILTSQTFQRTSVANEEARQGDPSAHLLSHFPSRRLEAEVIYDCMLTSIGKVSRQDPGFVLDNSKSKDRALYILTSSRSPLGLGLEIRKMFGLFGFDDSGRPMHDRDDNTSAQQALWWLNNPLPRYYADKLADRLLNDFASVPERIEAAHLLTLGSPPEKDTQTAILDYIDELMDQGASEKEAWSRACLGLFSTKAFRSLP